jgi:superfamily II DNA helicase RecQ
MLALTASATELVARDIMRHLRFGKEHILRSSFARPNLSYVVRDSGDKYENLLTNTSKNGECATVESINKEINENISLLSELIK